MIILVINCGSSSIKYQLFSMPEKKVLAKGLVERIGLDGPKLTHQVNLDKHKLDITASDHKQAMDVILKTLVDDKIGVIKNISDINAVGHRVVHGGEKYSESILIDDDVIHGIESFCDLAPLHNPPNLTGIRAAAAVMPKIPMVAVFDTAFHSTIPPHAFLYPIPYDLYKKYGIRKYGFHGTSHAYVTRRAAELLEKPINEINIITCHLGNGGSITAVKNGKSVDTSMGLTPLAGVMMGTRSGDVDPAIPFFLSGKEEFKDIAKIDTMLNKESGLLGISGLTSDMRDLEEAAEKDPNSRSKLALDMFAYRVQFFIGAYMAILPRVDAIVFTGGIGENGDIPRRDAIAPLANIGVKLHDERNKRMIRGKEGDIAAPDSAVRVLVIPTDEEGFIASETLRLVKE